MTNKQGTTRRITWRALIAVLAVAITTGFLASASGAPKAAAAGSATKAHLSSYTPRAVGELDCNGDSPVQKPLRQSALCTDIRGLSGVDNANTWGGKFYDNGVYIGHDEPDMTFNSSTPGSGDNVTWNETVGKDPSAAPTTTNPGHDVTHYFQLTPAPWFSMAMCDGNSYPQLPCTPQSDSNAASGLYPGAGGAFMEMQLYPPGNPPWVDSTSCDDTHWCAALTIDSLECTDQFAQCNNSCEEPVNFAFIQTNGVPAGPPSPQLADLTSDTPNSDTLLMNPGDKLKVHMWDAAVPGGGGAKAFKVVIDDLTTGRSGSMQASAANGFMNTSMVNCSGTPYNFQPEYSTAKRQNIIPWAALQTNISTEFETGHYEGCSSLAGKFTLNIGSGTDTAYSECVGGYETGGSEGAETSDALCYPQGDTHGFLDSAPDLATGCQDNYAQNGDLDFDGEPYYADWPTGTSPTATLAGSFVQQRPTSVGREYYSFFFQTDVALSESTCTAADLSGCTVPPNGPGHFYPYWTEAKSGKSCVIEFGNVHGARGENSFRQDSEFGKNLYTTLGYPEFEGSSHRNNCSAVG